MTNPWLEAPFKDFFDYWRSLTENGSKVPEKFAFNPMRLPKDLPEIAILELVGDDLVYRLTGTAVDARNESKLQGQPVGAELLDPENLRGIVAGAEILHSKIFGALMGFQRAFGSGRIGNQQMLCLPFVGPAGEKFLINRHHAPRDKASLTKLVRGTAAVTDYALFDAEGREVVLDAVPGE
jgi:hypothetical protein